MAQTPNFNPMIDPVSFQPKPIVSGVKDKGSTMSMLAGLGSLTAEGIAGYQEQSAYEDIDKLSSQLVQEYEYQSPSIIAETEASIAKDSPLIAQANLGITPAFESQEEAEAYNDQYSKVESSYRDKLSFLQKAQDQGKLSPEEFALRAKTLAKEVTARNPHLSREILNRLSLNLSSSGIQERMEVDKEYYAGIQKQYDFRIKQLSSGLDSIGANILMFRNRVTGEYELDKAESFLVDQKIKDNVKYQVEQELESQKIVDDKTLADYKKSGVFGQIADVYAKNYWAAALEAVNGEGDVDQVLTSLQMAIDENNRNIDRGFSQLSYDEDVRRVIENTKKTGQLVYDTIKNSVTREGQKEQAQNIATIDNLLETQQVRDALGGNIKRFEILNTFLSNPYLKEMIAKKDYEALSNLLITYGQQLNGFRIGQENLSVNPATGASNFTSLNTGQISAIASGNYDEAYVGAYNNQVADRHKAVTSIESPQQKFNEVQQLLTEYASPEFAKAAAVLNPEYKQEAFTLIQGQSAPLAKSIQSLEDTGVEFGFNSDGLLEVTNNKATNKDLVNFVDRVNTNLKAFANLNGTSTKNSSKIYFDTFYTNVFNPNALVDAEQEYKSVAGTLLSKVKPLEAGSRVSVPFSQEAMIGSSGLTREIPTAFAMQTDTTRRPGYGISPIDYTKAGKELDKEKDRFRQDYLTQMLLKYDGDERKAVAAYISGATEVDKAISKAAKKGENGLWVSYLPDRSAKALANSKIISSKETSILDSMIPKLREKQEAIRQANPQEYAQIFENGTGVALAQDIAKDLGLNGVDVTWNAVYDYMKQNNLLPLEEIAKTKSTREASGTLYTAEQQENDSLVIKRKYATMYEEQKRLRDNKVITNQEFMDRASNFNRMLKEELASKGLK
jgi:hypothetical protein